MQVVHRVRGVGVEGGTYMRLVKNLCTEMGMGGGRDADVDWSKLNCVCRHGCDGGSAVVKMMQQLRWSGGVEGSEDKTAMQVWGTETGCGGGCAEVQTLTCLCCAITEAIWQLFLWNVGFEERRSTAH